MSDKKHSRRSLGPTALAVLEELGSGEFTRTATISERIGMSKDAVLASIKTLRGRGFLIEMDEASVASRGWRLLPFPHLEWLPVEHVGLYWDLTKRHDYTATEARAIVVDHMEVLARRRARLAA